jgi:hypothetical protein
MTEQERNARGALAIARILLAANDEELADYCAAVGIDDPRDFREFLKEDVPAFHAELKKREH